jgi:hypothetical protein
MEAEFGLSKKREDKDFIDFLVLLAKKEIGIVLTPFLKER